MKGRKYDGQMKEKINVKQNTTQKAKDLEPWIYEKAGTKCFKCVNTSRTTISTRPVDKKNHVLSHARRNTEFWLWQTEYILGHLWERFGDTNGVMQSLSSKDKQYNDQAKKDKQYNDQTKKDKQCNDQAKKGQTIQ